MGSSCCCSHSKEKELVRKTTKKNGKTVALERSEAKAIESKLSSLVKIVSSPSQLSFEQATQIYQVPGNEFQRKRDVLKSRGYVLEKLLGTGEFSKVFSGMTVDTNKTIACKIAYFGKKGHQKREKKMSDTMTELYILEKVRHPHIVHLFDHFMINDEFYFILQYAAGGTLKIYLKSKDPLSEEESKVKFAQILSAVRFMHNLGIAHRDLKLDNILLDQESNCLVSDFERSTTTVSFEKRHVIMNSSYIGTQTRYLAPEILEDEKDISKGKQYDPFLADVWALGVILYTMLNRRHPFDSNDKRTMFEKQLSKQFRPGKKLRKKLSQEVKSLIEQMLEPNLNQRIDCNEIAKNSWVQSEISKIKDPERPVMSEKINKDK